MDHTGRMGYMDAMPRTFPVSSSRTQDVYERLRTELLNGRAEPATRLKINDLCRAHGVSLSAVREALSRLTSEGLVIAEPQRGFSVAPVSASELTDLTQVRTQIECLCLGRAIAVGDVDWEAQVVAAFHHLSRTPERDAKDPERMSDARSAAHAAFHDALASGCDSPWLLRLREMLYVQSERYRRLSVSFKGIARDLNREHQDIMEATLARDDKRARRLMTKHLELTMKMLLSQAHLAAPVSAPDRQVPLSDLLAKSRAPSQPAAKVRGSGERGGPARSAVRAGVRQERPAGHGMPQLES
jgi:DNA-binding GntR family transcriptional regulator